jgi:hypothetical protein
MYFLGNIIYFNLYRAVWQCGPLKEKGWALLKYIPPFPIKDMLCNITFILKETMHTQNNNITPTS